MLLELPTRSIDVPATCSAPGVVPWKSAWQVQLAARGRVFGFLGDHRLTIDRPSHEEKEKTKKLHETSKNLVI